MKSIHFVAYAYTATPLLENHTKNGRAFLSLEDGHYYAVEIESAEGFELDNTPYYFEVKDGKTTTLTVENKSLSGILIHKIDSTTGEGIYGATFLLYDGNKNPIGQYESDQDGWVYITGLTESGRYYIRELENEGYNVDTQMKTVYVRAGKTIEIEWENEPKEKNKRRSAEVIADNVYFGDSKPKDDNGDDGDVPFYGGYPGSDEGFGVPPGFTPNFGAEEGELPY